MERKNGGRGEMKRKGEKGDVEEEGRGSGKKGKR